MTPDRTGPLAAAAIGGAAVVVLASGTDDGPGLCLFRHATGWYCPGCGGTRAVAHLVRGEVGAAWGDHPWVVLVAAQLAVAALVVAVGVLLAAGRVARRRAGGPRARSATRAPARGPGRGPGRGRAWHPPVRWTAIVGANVAALFTIWTVRIAAHDIPSFLT